MHSFIYQIKAINRPTNDELIDEDYFDESYLNEHGVDYMTLLEDGSERRNDALENLKEILPESMFKVDGDCIEVISDGKEVFEAWKKYMLELVSNMEYQLEVKTADDFCHDFCGVGSYLVEKNAKTLINTYSLFYSLDEDGSVFETLSSGTSLVLFAKRYVGKKLYVGSIFDYHW